MLLSMSTWDKINHSSLKLQQEIRVQVKTAREGKKSLKAKITELQGIIQGFFWNISYWKL